MASVKDVAAADFIPALAAHLKKSGKLQVPAWTELAKTASFKEHGPQDPDWFYTHAAALARHIYLRRGVGVGALRKVYGGKVRRGCAPNHFGLASGSVQRKALQALEKVKILEQIPSGKGRQITPTGRRELDRIANQVIAAKQGAAAAAADE
ncbi:hypothetical protein AMAG_16070 [Allomyces macrogynus ATCC 38327]|uniref:40S ribosomal protein S19 n=1 Tax=Allomyces macrogynus (strain ATCC 38327) TaxID=578462 RepID=A0A0L0TAM1_ALLM3|nr:hypothetical protein GGF32_008314 [Allomyces javanicus]KAJ3361758.1 hypothetical protein GGF31_002040 [Allomyces arbusculus]KNE59719.1 hypothetical protein AMAG_05183 [Allomyces macrogynus ATCC 38327]KNE71766.1 hypothetical protein AMAG_16070 [Allomyces macrogynus ATCC 38327]|eukprot:KNE59719.1 hypothetical protein AMAG_05183 [Allomyces macrogynus ATCC 38327]